MENVEESRRWMKDAKSHFQRAFRCFNQNDWQGVVQSAQLAIELGVKAMIAGFEEPDWTHSPDRQLIRMVDERREEISERFDQKMVDALIMTAKNARTAAPWHGWSVYGRAKEDSTGWIPAVELCTREIAEELYERATSTFQTVERFLNMM